MNIDEKAYEVLHRAVKNIKHSPMWSKKQRNDLIRDELNNMLLNDKNNKQAIEGALGILDILRKHE